MEKGRFFEARQKCIDLGCPTTEIDDKVEAIQRDVPQRLNRREYSVLQNEFIACIGLIDTAFVCSTFIDVSFHPYLIQFLIELHKRGKAEKEHTELLFELFDQSRSETKLVEFMDSIKAATLTRSTDPEARLFLDNLDGETAVKILKRNGKEKEALQLACDLECIDYRLSLLISYQKNFDDAVALLEKDRRRATLMKYGPQLLEHGSESVQQRIVSLAAYLWTWRRDEAPIDSAAQYVNLFASSRRHCRDFLEKVMTLRPTKLFWSVSISLRIPNSGDDTDNLDGEWADAETALTLIKKKWREYDYEHVLRACAAADFTKGTVLLLTMKGSLDEAVGILVSRNESALLMEWFNENEKKIQEDGRHRQLVSSVFEYFVSQFDWLMSFPKGKEFFKHLLDIARKNIPFGTVLEVMLRSRTITVGFIREELMEYAKGVEQERARVLHAHKRTLVELEHADADVYSLEYETKQFKNEICDKCKQPLDLPFVCLMSGAVYHQACLEMPTAETVSEALEEQVVERQQTPWDDVCGAIASGMLQ